MLAARSDHDEAFADVGTFAELEELVDDAGIDDETYLEASGVDTDAVSEAVDRFEGGSSQSRKEIVKAALRELDQPDESAVVSYASEHGVPETYTKQALTKLVQTGAASEHRGTYRLL